MMNSINRHLSPPPPHTTRILNLKNINCIRQTKSEYKIYIELENIIFFFLQTLSSSHFMIIFFLGWICMVTLPFTTPSITQIKRLLNFYSGKIKIVLKKCLWKERYFFKSHHKICHYNKKK